MAARELSAGISTKFGIRITLKGSMQKQPTNQTNKQKQHLKSAGNLMFEKKHVHSEFPHPKTHALGTSETKRRASWVFKDKPRGRDK